MAFAINDHGQVVGASGDCTTFNANSDQVNLQGLHALLWQDGKAIDLGNLGGTGSVSGNVAIAINNQGQVIGTSFLHDNTTFHGFVWTKDTGMRDLGKVSGDMYSAALGINDKGDIVGISLDASFSPHAFLRQNGGDRPTFRGK